MKILFVCTGNTCRSPMAEGVARAYAKDMGLDVNVLSAGLFCANGALPTEHAVQAVASIADISEHRSRPLSVEFVNAADLVIGMTEDHKKVLLRQFPMDVDKIKTLAEWGGETEDVEDPFGQSQAVYDACAAQIERLVKRGLETLEAGE